MFESCNKDGMSNNLFFPIGVLQYWCSISNILQQTIVKSDIQEMIAFIDI